MKKMKNIIIAVVSFFVTVICNAQVFSIYETLSSDVLPNGYLKDVTNFQNQFVGTWIYQNGLEYLEVRFIKKEMMLTDPGDKQFYEDNLVGEYKYIDSNGIQKVNSLSNLNLNHNSVFKYNMYSGMKLTQANAPFCNICPPGTERLYVHFNEPANDDFLLSAKFVIRRVIENGIEKLKVQFVNISQAVGRKKGDFLSPSTFTNFSLPYGEYILIKQ